MAEIHEDVLLNHGFAGRLSDYRRALLRAKMDLYPHLSDEDLSYTRDEADVYCAEVRRRIEVPTLPRVFILRCLNGIRKRGLRRQFLLQD